METEDVFQPSGHFHSSLWVLSLFCYARVSEVNGLMLSLYGPTMFFFAEGGDGAFPIEPP
jgi:hypothetical protein